jgi:hypothetical protein
MISCLVKRGVVLFEFSLLIPGMLFSQSVWVMIVYCPRGRMASLISKCNIYLSYKLCSFMLNVVASPLPSFFASLLVSTHSNLLVSNLPFFFP